MGHDSLGLGLRKAIISDYNAGMAQNELCSKYNLQKWTVSRLLKMYQSTGNVIVRHKGGRNRSTSKREDSQIVISAKKDPFKSASIIRDEF